MKNKTIKIHNFKNENYKFKREHYNSGNGILPKIWGPSLWHFLHTISFNYPVNPTDEHKINYYNFILSLKNILPCGKCRENLEKNLKILPLTIDDMKNRYTFSLYIYNLHETVNNMLNKKSNLTYNNVKNTYEHFRARCNKSKKTHIGCNDPLNGLKTKCVLQIIPENEKCNTFQMKINTNKI